MIKKKSKSKVKIKNNTQKRILTRSTKKNFLSYNLQKNPISSESLHVQRFQKVTVEMSSNHNDADDTRREAATLVQFAQKEPRLSVVSNNTPLNGNLSLLKKNKTFLNISM